MVADMNLNMKLNLREFVNYRHPNPWRVWKGGSGLQLLTKFPVHPLHPLERVQWAENSVLLDV
eukprot:8771758-Karenia_brevis.AAC.1